MLTQICAYILLWFLSKEICLWGNSHGLIKQDSCYLKHLITIESERVRFGYRALLCIWLKQCISHADTVGSIACLSSKADGEGHKGTRCICSFNSLCHTGCNTLYRTCHQYMLAHKRFTVQMWTECRWTHMSNMLHTIPRVHTFCPSAAVCFMHPTYACGTLSAHLCVWFPLRNTIMKITTRQSSIKITARPSQQKNY